NASHPVFYGLRLINWQDQVYTVGDIYFYPLELRESLLVYLQRNLLEPGFMVPPKISDLLKDRGYLFNIMQQIVTDMSRAKEEEEEDEKEKPVEEEMPAPAPEKEVEATHCRSQFMVENYNQVKDELDKTDLIKFNGKDDRYLNYYWYRNPGKLEMNEKDGVIRLSNTKITVETLGENNLEDIKITLNKLLGNKVRFMYDIKEKRRNFALE
ncbi:MAG: hypothetical protein ACLFQV_05375, partial [Vulcanimicrobiota bacterium]